MMFEVSLCNEVVADLPFAAQCNLAAELGYAGLEVAPYTLSDDPAQISQKERARLRWVAEDAGIRITGLHWLLTTPKGMSITTSDKHVHSATIDHMRHMCDLCADLGGSVLVHGSPKQRSLGDALSPEIGRENARRAFAVAAQAAQEAGVIYCIEPLAADLTDYVTTIDEAAQIVASVASPYLKTMIDTSSAWAGEVEAPDALVRRQLSNGTLAHVHFNDTNRRGPGQGAHSFGAIIRALLDTGYSGIIGVEPFDYFPDGPTAAARAIGYIQGLIETEEQRP